MLSFKSFFYVALVLSLWVNVSIAQESEHGEQVEHGEESSHSEGGTGDKDAPKHGKIQALTDCASAHYEGFKFTNCKTAMGYLASQDFFDDKPSFEATFETCTAKLYTSNKKDIDVSRHTLSSILSGNSDGLRSFLAHCGQQPGEITLKEANKDKADLILSFEYKDHE